MKALVTGATGFVGSAVVRELLQNGEEVKVLVRPSSDRLNLKGLDVEVAEGDITDYESIRSALSGCDRAYHVAALYTMDDPEEAYYRINVAGSRNLFPGLPEDAGVARVVYTSTIAAVGASQKDKPADEDTVWDMGDLYVPYVTTKYIAEFEAYRAMAQGLTVVIVNPCAPWAPGTGNPHPPANFSWTFSTAGCRSTAPVSFNVVDVDDVARGHRLAMEKGRPGQRYILGNENVSLREVLRTVARSSGVRGPLMAIPYLVGVIFSFFAELVVTENFRKPTLFTVDGARFVLKIRCADNRKAVSELGWEPAPWEECLKKAIRWYHDEGYIEKDPLTMILPPLTGHSKSPLAVMPAKEGVDFLCILPFCHSRANGNPSASWCCGMPASAGMTQMWHLSTPWKAGIHNHLKRLDSRFHGNDDRGEIPNKSTPSFAGMT